MKIIHISDTHGAHRRMAALPEGDVLVHSGDFTMTGSEAEVLDFLEWFCDQPYKHKIFIAGNHDMCLYGASIDGLDDNVHYLCNTGIEIDGVKFYGVPMFMEDCVTDRQCRYYARIPADTDVLITHTPPFEILDFDDEIHYGSEEVLAKVKEVKPQLHLFGHVHRDHGIKHIGSTTFSNAAIMCSAYTYLQEPNIIEIQNQP